MSTVLLFSLASIAIFIELNPSFNTKSIRIKFCLFLFSVSAIITAGGISYGWIGILASIMTLLVGSFWGVIFNKKVNEK